MPALPFTTYSSGFSLPSPSIFTAAWPAMLKNKTIGTLRQLHLPNSSI